MKKIIFSTIFALAIFGFGFTSEAAETENYCCGNGYYSDNSCCDSYDCDGNYCGYGRGCGCR